MIKNERQYRVTKAQADKFERALSDLTSRPLNGTHPLLRKAEEDALRSQLVDLRTDLEEYEQLQAGEQQVFECNSFEELPKALIRARIARGLTQKDLAERLSLAEQQIQRYEATEYASASLSRIKDVIEALDLKVCQEVMLPERSLTPRAFFKRMSEAGIDREFLLNRILPASMAETLNAQESALDPDTLVRRAAAYVSGVFGWSEGAVLGTAPLTLSPSHADSVRFKMPAGATEKKVAAYTVYAHYLAMLVLQITSHLQPKPVPMNPKVVRQEITAAFGPLSFSTGLAYVWSLGIPVLPLNDPGGFHGACWRLRGRNVIVIKQRTRSSARMLFDLLHELYHAGQHAGESEFGVVEEPETSPERRHSAEEQAASQFAGDVSLGNRAEYLAERCVEVAQGRLERLKRAVQKVAADEQIPVGFLANYLAFRLSLQGLNWWGAATNLQPQDEEPWLIARNHLILKADLSRIAAPDLQVLIRALTPQEV